MSGLAITITERGRAALIASRGTNPITITQVGVTAADFTPSPTALTLPGEIKRLTTFSGEASDAYTIHITLRDDSIDDYELRGFGLYLSDGTLFGIYGNGPALIMEKASASMLLLAIDIAFTASDAKQVSFGDTNFLNPPATTEREGVVELATESEAAAGTDTTRAVTPKAMLSAVTGWINTRFGNGAPSDFIKSILASTSAAVLRTALGLKSAALKDEGAGNGLDADKLDGQEGSYYANVLARLGYTPANKAGDTFAGAVTIFDTGYAATVKNLGSIASGFNVLRSDGKAGLSIGYVNSNNGDSYLQAQRTDTAVASNLLLNPNGGLVTINGQSAWHAGNDGSGSGMDADMLDGLHGSSYVKNDSGTYSINIYGKAAAAASATALIMNDANQVRYANDAAGLAKENNVAVLSWYGFSISPSIAGCPVAQYTPAFSVDARMGNVYAFSNYYAGSNIVWHAGNDGAGSGLDADLFDGQDSSTFVRAGITSKSGPIDIWSDGSTASPARSSFLRVASSNNANTTALYVEQQRYDQDVLALRNTQVRASGNLISATSADGGNFTIDARANAYANGNAIWNAGNDGAGSGCDADMLDGYHASAFLDGKCAAYILFYVSNGNAYTAASAGASIQSHQQGGIFYFTVANNCPIGFAMGMAAPISYVDGINVIPPAQRMSGNGETYHFEFKYTSSKSLTDPGWALVMWF